MVPNAPSVDWEAFRSFTLLQHVRFFFLRCNLPPVSNHVYLFVGLAEILVCRFLINKRSNHRRTCLRRSLYLRSMRRAPSLSTPPKSTHRHPIPILSDGQMVRRDKTIGIAGVHICRCIFRGTELYSGSESKPHARPLVAPALRTDGFNIAVQFQECDGLPLPVTAELLLVRRRSRERGSVPGNSLRAHHRTTPAWTLERRRQLILKQKKNFV